MTSEKIILYSHIRTITVSGGWRNYGWYLTNGLGGPTVHPSQVLRDVLRRLEAAKAGVACSAS